jgi:archaellum component FlaC
MSEPDSSNRMKESNGSSGLGLWLGIGGAYILLSAFVLFSIYGRLGTLEASLATSSEQQARLAERLDATESSLQTTVAGVNQKLDTAPQQIETRSVQLTRQHRASLSRLVKEQQRQMATVTGEVEGVKSEVGDVKTDVETAKSDLAATKDRLEHTIGDLGLQSGLIAHTREELADLRRRGERNYYEFTLLKGRRPVPVSTISLQLKKVNPKKSKFTLNVIADDRTIEKKDRTMYEPLQFYTAKDRHLYEVVIFTADKSKVTGYLSTPKEHIVAQMSPETK